LVAATVKVDGLPAGTEVGLAVIATVGAAVEPLKLVPPHPEKSTGNNRPGAIETRTLRIDMPKRAFAKVISFSPTRGYAKPAGPSNTRILHARLSSGQPSRQTCSAIVSINAKAGSRSLSLRRNLDRVLLPGHSVTIPICFDACMPQLRCSHACIARDSLHPATIADGSSCNQTCGVIAPHWALGSVALLHAFHDPSLLSTSSIQLGPQRLPSGYSSQREQYHGGPPCHLFVAPATWRVNPS